MRSNSVLLALSATAAAVAAQDLATALSGQETLTTLANLLGQVQNTTEFLASRKGVTLFAPNDDAFAEIKAMGGIFSIEEAIVDPGLIEQILRYHLYKEVIMSANITEVPQFIPGYLDYSGFVLDGEVSGSNVTGGQVVQVNLDSEGNALVTSGIKRASTVTVADIEFDNGIIHIIDSLLLIPLSVSETLISGNWTALAGAAAQTDLVTPLESLSDITIFCPNNDAFQRLAAGSLDVSNKGLAEILQYHVVQGTVGYSTALSNTTLPTLNGKDVQITITDDGAVFVNSARVINANVLIENGVLHVIDEVLSPADRSYQPSEIANPLTSLASVVPFTSGIQPETSIYSELTPTTRLVAAGLVTTTATSSGAAATSNGVVPATGAGMRNELPALAAAALGVVVIAVGL